MEQPALAPSVKLHELDQQGTTTYRLVSPAGREWQVHALLYYVALHANGENTLSEIAQRVSESQAEPVNAETVRQIVAWLQHRGMLVNEAGVATADAPPPRGFAQVRWPILKGEPLRRLSALLTWTWNPWFMAVAIALATLVRIGPYSQIWADQLLLQAAHRPWEILSGSGAVLVGAATFVLGLLHELGHATAATSVGVQVQEVGTGLHIIYPICYTKLADTWKADRSQRVVVAAGGVYFQYLLGALLYAYLNVQFNGLVAAVALANDLTLVSNFQPFLQFDGYWLLSHATGVVNLQRRGWGQVLEWITLGARKDTFLSTFGPVQRVVIGVYGLGNVAFLCFFLWGLAQWTGVLVRALPTQFWLLITQGLTPERVYTMIQGLIWGVLIYNVWRRVRAGLLPPLKRRWRRRWRLLHRAVP